MGESGSAKIQQEANALPKNEHQRAELVNDITKMLESVQPLSSPECCIYKVPDSLRKLNEEAYTPQVISIGPFHHGNEKLQTMENYKARYLKRFMERAEIDLKNLICTIEDSEKSVRQCYAETIPLSSAEFVKMILMDASFIIEFFFRNRFNEWTSDDRIVLKPWLAARMQLDLILLENQLPFFIIDKLFDLAFPSRQALPSFVELTFEYFHSYNRQERSPDPELEILHFIDLLRNFYLPPHSRLPKRKPKIVEHMYSATQLDGVGLKFEADRSSNCLLDLNLDYKKGVLKIPHFTLDNATELYARNLMALEQCHYPIKAYVTDYFILLDFLINNEKDVDLLGQKGIVVNGLGDNDITFINNLGTSIIYSSMSSNYYDLCNNLKKFYEDPTHGWLASLKQDYFGTPWKAASTTTVVVLLILTFIQTVCSIIAALPHDKSLSNCS